LLLLVLASVCEPYVSNFHSTWNYIDITSMINFNHKHLPNARKLQSIIQGNFVSFLPTKDYNKYVLATWALP
jgi:hypothetical protein